MITRPFNLQEKIYYFGDYQPYLTSEGRITRAWELEILTLIDLPAPLPLSFNLDQKVTKISCHKKISIHLKNALDQLFALPNVWSTINNYGGCYNFRLQRKSKSELSAHCWGIAIDLDVTDNPFGRCPQVDPMTIKIFRDNGFIWGGLFRGNRVDGMHFEFADSTRLMEIA